MIKPSNPEQLLQVEDLRTSFFIKDREVRAVDGVSFDIKPGEVLGLVGESGCGKSATSLSILRLIPNPPGKIVGGRILYNGEDLLDYSEKQMRDVRGNQISMIFQEPMTALNPVFTVGNQIGEVFRVHRGMSRKEAFEASVEMLERVRMPEPRKRAGEYPHQLSGGMRQRVMIAMALACEPDLLIADEPTTALDVTVQAQILALIDQLRVERNCAVLLITHDLGVVAEVCHRVAVMYAGEIVEENTVEQIFADPKHPYTQGLIKCVPRVDEVRPRKLYTIPGTVPSAGEEIQGCRFAPRCEFRMPECTKYFPELKPLQDSGGTVRCFLHHPPPSQE
ncbi:MAG: ABC transporter ATP-binding protein [Candidatus Omnitrophica bacterium]|nr:ABC transporter ATP-binding protein [Candidatus Omnitrophota bacterium]MCA9442020.1 ABC transporter ATP-binding protein [Candidatus Omnitrophota bacterium]MCB9770760.1 ABC transporter ATP-binding protein [Candidatus Omnitrophota bacterium]